MMTREGRGEIYAGDEAWLAWFDVCSVAGCPADFAAALGAEVESALFARLSRWGVTREEAASEDPVAFFDAYFQLKGSRETGKPLKSYFAHRIATEGIRLRDFVCGTLFGAASGRIRDIAVDWIAANKGWKARTVTGSDGRRRFAWENAGDGEDGALEGADTTDPAAFLDEEPLRRAIEDALVRTARKTGVEKSQVALLSLVTALDVPLTDPIVLGALGVGKSRAYALREKVMKTLGKTIAGIEGADDPLVGRLLLEVGEAAVAPDVRHRLEAAS